MRMTMLLDRDKEETRIKTINMKRSKMNDTEIEKICALQDQDGRSRCIALPRIRTTMMNDCAVVPCAVIVLILRRWCANSKAMIVFERILSLFHLWLPRTDVLVVLGYYVERYSRSHDGAIIVSINLLTHPFWF